MSDKPQNGDRSRGRAPGLYDPAPPQGVTGIEVVGAVASALWVALSAGYVLMVGTGIPGAAGFVLGLMVIVLPVALIWVSVLAARAARTVRTESARLGAAIDALRQAYVVQQQTGRTEALNPALAKRLDEIARAQAAMDARLTLFASAHIAEGGLALDPVAEPEAADDDQQALSLGTPPEAQSRLSNADFIRALHFPETAEDTEGFAALRRALRDRQAAHLIQAAQDVLTLLSQDGIYMDDLRPDMARPETWRAFGQGARGRAVAALGGVHDRAALAMTAGRMKQDPIFRDAVHHFLRRFDKTFAAFEPQASDSEINDFAATRTARAFMLLGRVAGTFD
ncbi:hypothetical protein [Citreimonas salinaria]|uniref:Uncharacterized protein n=1 Tax=Citreimonas salinaria TaxID=321339 RepID=A0A1H3HS67_9RHOB|nr:hypothetical protein [Citreimonas salinaria]SDY17604.1 hypothetical protein SAMN05444340_10494 [Citreimonas salinaria]